MIDLGFAEDFKIERKIRLDLQIFENKSFGSVRTIIENDTVLFCGSDIAKSLKYARPNDAVSAHCKGTVKRRTPTAGGEQEMSFIPESDVYRLIARSKMEEAEQFQKWLFEDVLPTIRSTGGYVANDDLFTNTYLPFADEATRGLFKVQLQVIREQNVMIQKQQNLLDEQKPQVEFAETVQKSCDNILMRDLAKLMCDKAINIGEKRLYRLLRDNRVLMDDNSPYQSYIDRGYFKVREGAYSTQYGTIKLNNTTLVTPKGQVWLVNKVREWAA